VCYDSLRLSKDKQHLLPIALKLNALTPIPCQRESILSAAVKATLFEPVLTWLLLGKSCAQIVSISGTLINIFGLPILPTHELILRHVSFLRRGKLYLCAIRQLENGTLLPDNRTCVVAWRVSVFDTHSGLIIRQIFGNTSIL